MPEPPKAPVSNAERLGVNFPFLLSIQHPELTVQEMFKLTQAFDLYEVESSSGPEIVKEYIAVDVLELTPTVTTVKVTPAQQQPYADLLQRVLAMLLAITKKFPKKTFKVVRLTWEVDQTGVASDLRGMLRKVK